VLRCFWPITTNLPNSLLVGRKEYKNVDDHHCFALIFSEINSVYEQVETKQNPIFNFAKGKTKQVAQKYILL